MNKLLFKQKNFNFHLKRELTGKNAGNHRGIVGGKGISGRP